ncbi:SIR2 family protein [Orenia marismortui]|uniref:SIR2-like protein n=1 Tax=Orenia marismortui TaxID=46469 RepID=A0A4R8GDI7_9FIRM|nr:SIR2 family protein [Orenia marismortui]TDX43546.1 SIR2-like protein [Orenia marismortui]
MKADLKKLRELYYSNQLVPFIGAGFSVPFNVPSWGNLIKEISSNYVNKELQPAINRLLDDFEYWEAVDLVLKFSNLMEEELQDEIVSLIRDNQQKLEDSKKHNYYDIGTMNFPLYITTNYDHLLQDYIDDKTYTPQILSKIEINTQHLLNHSEGKKILHLHGNISDPYTIVITKSKYNELYDNNKYKQLFSLFSATKTFLFLGFSFEDQFIRQLIKDHRDLFRGKHYILLDNPDPKQIKNLKEDYGLKVISYDSTETSHVVEIRKILKEIKKKGNIEIELNQSEDRLIDTPYTKKDKERLEENLFCEKIKLEEIDKITLELAKIYFFRADEYIHKLKKYNLGKEVINHILEMVLIKHMELFKKVYKEHGDSQKFIDTVHDVLKDIDYGRIEEDLRRSIYPHDFENIGLVHILADDKEQEIWWGKKRLEGLI